MWQVLPLGPTGAGDSPYGTLSAFAGNPLLISPERLVEEGLVPEGGGSRGGLMRRRTGSDSEAHAAARHACSGASVETLPRPDRRRSARTSRAIGVAPEQATGCATGRSFRRSGRSSAGRRGSGGRRAWPAATPRALRSAEADLAAEIAFHEFVQFLFFRQWRQIRDEAAARGIAILGDVPIYVVHDSADVWVNQRLFALDAAGEPDLVAGVPPDYFSKTGQLWGYPLYRWDRMEETAFAWWVERLRRNRELADVLRIDHFRGFAEYWAVEAGETTAVQRAVDSGARPEALRPPANGARRAGPRGRGPGHDHPRRGRPARGAPDPGMKVLQFAFSEDDSPYLPHNHVPASVVYTGTHDNDTTRGWFATAGPEERRRLRDYLGSDAESVVWDFIRAAYESVADRAIVPMQDLLELPTEARMNDPGRPGRQLDLEARRGRAPGGAGQAFSGPGGSLRPPSGGLVFL